MDRETAVAIIHNTISPYRNDLFERISEHVDLMVYFCFEEESDRLWDTSLEGYTFDRHLLRSANVGPFVLNYLLPIRILLSDRDAYVAVDTFSTIVTTFLTLLVSKIRHKPFVLWSGAMKTPTSYERLPELIHNASTGPVLKRIGIECLKRFETAYRKILYRHADAFVAYSNKAREYLIARGADPDDIFVGGQVMPDSQLPTPPDSEKVLANNGKITILSLGYLRDVKGIDFLIEAFSEIEHEDVRLVVAGDGNKREELERQAERDDRISFVGYVEGDTKAAYYSEADIFVLPTLHDPWGLVLNESMHYGLPVITTNAAAGAEHLVRGNGIVVPPKDPHALGNALSVLIHNKDLRDQMSERSKEIIAEENTMSQGIKPFLEALDHASDES